MVLNGLSYTGFPISLLEMGGALLPPMGGGGGGGTWCRRWGEHPAKWGERSILVHVRTWAFVIFALLQGVCVCVRLSIIFQSSNFLCVILKN